MNSQSRITLELGKRGGRPCVRPMRIPVADVLEREQERGATHNPVRKFKNKMF
jgi:uncharacterized protein (DUF433 family)